MAQTFGRRRQIDRYDGQTIFIGSQVAYELGNYLGGGASGSVYQAVDVASPKPQEKSVAIKILKPLGYKILPYGQLAKCLVASRGQSLNQKQIHGKAPLTIDNLWWLVHPSSEHVYAAYEDTSRGQLRELTLPRCIEIWGWAPFGSDQLSSEVIEKKNQGSQSFVVSNTSIIQLPIVAPKYLKWLQSRATICREMNNMIHIGEHPNIVDLLEVLELIQDSKAVLFLVLEFVNGGELFDRMKRSSGPGTPSDDFARRYFSQLLSGIDYCHCKGVVHRDLKPENLLLSDPSETAILKIADFGLSAVVFATEGVDTTFFPTNSHPSPSPNHFSASGGNDRDIVSCFNSQGTNNEGHHVQFNQPQSPIQILHSPGASPGQQQQPFSTPIGTPSPVPLRRLRSVVGSPHYIAPEIVNHEDACGYDGRKVDMWSAGVILYSLLTGSLPFGSDLSSCPRYKLYKQWMLLEHGPAVRDGRSKDLALPAWFFPPSISPLAGSLILQLIHIDPQQRCTASDALRHPWSTGEGSKSSSSSSSNDSSSRSQQKGTKPMSPEDLPCNSSYLDREREREKDKMKLSKVVMKEQKERRMISAPPSPKITATSQPPPKSVKPPKSPPSSSLPIPIPIPPTLSKNLESVSPGSGSPTLTSLASVARALAPFSIDSVDKAVEEIVITEENTQCTFIHSLLPVQHTQQQHFDQQPSATVDEVMASSRSDATSSRSSDEKINQQSAARLRVQQSTSNQPPVNSENASALSATYPAVHTLIPHNGPHPLSLPYAPKATGRPSSAPLAGLSDSARSRSDASASQTKNSGNGPKSATRVDQCRQGQDREEEERKERYQSILEQQRQKEAAALAMDPRAESAHVGPTPLPDTYPQPVPHSNSNAYSSASPNSNSNRDSDPPEQAI